MLAPKTIDGQNSADPEPPQISQTDYSNLTLIAELELGTIPPQQEPAAKVSNVRHLASYDVRIRDNKPDSGIIVPGFLPRCKDAAPTQIDHNTLLQPHEEVGETTNPLSHIEALFRALYAENPEYNLHDVDLVIQTAKLMRHLIEGMESRLYYDFSIYAEVVRDKTVLLTDGRRHSLGGRWYQRQMVRKIMDATAVKDVDGAFAHYRIVRYSFGGLECIVRFEINSCEFSTPRPESTRPSPGAIDTVGRRVSRAGWRVDTPSTIVFGGFKFAAFETAKGSFLPGLWITQTPKMVHARRIRNVYKPALYKLEFYEMTDYVREWENTNSEVLGRLASLLNWVIKTAQSAPRKRIRIVINPRNSPKSVQAFNDPMDTPSLPPELYAKWERESRPSAKQEAGDKLATGEQDPKEEMVEQDTNIVEQLLEKGETIPLEYDPYRHHSSLHQRSYSASEIERTGLLILDDDVQEYRLSQSFPG